MLSKIISEGSMLGDSHKVISALGEGGFGVVAKCQHTVTGKIVAVKVSKNHRLKDLKVAKEEICIMKSLRILDPDVSNIIRWYGFFFHKDKVCMSFELMDLCLFEYLVQKPKTCTVREMAPLIFQLATALLYLSTVGVIHSDLKSKNIMVVDRHQTPIRLKIIDFGLASHVKDENYSRGGTVPYQAPEVLVSAPFDAAIDMWALGLVAVEMATGYALYPGKNKYEILRCIIEAQGLPPDRVLNQGQLTSYYFFRDKRGWSLKSPQTIFEELAMKAGDIRPYGPKCLEDVEWMMVMRQPNREVRQRQLFLDLVKQMLELDSARRIKPLHVLKHPLFTANGDSLNHFEETGEGQKATLCDHCILQLREPGDSSSSAWSNECLIERNVLPKRWIWKLLDQVSALAKNMFSWRRRQNVLVM